MNVSITLDATIRRTRFEAGATVVRVDAIALRPECTGVLDSRELYDNPLSAESIVGSYQSQ